MSPDIVRNLRKSFRIIIADGHHSERTGMEAKTAAGTIRHRRDHR
jgi:hypothetical protein